MTYVEFILAEVTVVLALAWCLSQFLFRRRTSRDLVWRTALVIVAVSPGLTLLQAKLVPWQWRFPLLPPAVATEAPSSAATTEPLPNDYGYYPTVPPTESATAQASRVAPQRPAGRAPATGRVGPPPPALDATNVDSRLIEPATASSPQDRFSWRALVMWIWLAISFLCCVRIGLAAWNAQRLVVTAKPVSELTWCDLNQWCAVHVGLTRPATLMTSSRIDVPVVTGLLHPTIVVPPSLLADDARLQVRAALLHEYGHVRRHDLPFDLLLKVVVALFWPHPLIHLMARELCRLREEICDNYVLAAESPVAYADLLLRLAVGKRLADSALIGLGMFARRSPLEARVSGLLAPARHLDTRTPQWTRVLVLGATSVAVLASVVVRFERATAAPPGDSTPVLSANDPRISPAGDAPSEHPSEAVKADTEPAPRSFDFRIVTADGKPVAGAVVKPWALAAFGGGFSFGEDAVLPVTHTDAKGIARVVFTKEMEGTVTGMYGETWMSGYPKIGLHIEHPDHPVWKEYIHLAGNPRIVLPNSVTIMVRAHRADDSAPLRRLCPQLSRRLEPAWNEKDGVLTIRRVDLGSEHPSRWLRVVHAPEQGDLWFSEMIDLKHLPGNPIVLDVALRPGSRFEGRLAAQVPRPVKNGHVFAIAVAGPEAQDIGWEAAAEIADDGTFVLEFLPADELVQIIAICDDWVSRSPTKAEMEAYTQTHGFPKSVSFTCAAGQVAPQVYRLRGPLTRTTIPMQPTAACEVKVVDTAGSPIPDALVQFWPNQVTFRGGSWALGFRRDGAESVRAQLASNDHHTDPPRRVDGHEYSAATNPQGIALIRGLPAAGDEPEAFREMQFLVACKGYDVVPNFPSAGQPRSPFPLLVAELAAGKTAKVTVRMTQQSAPGEQPDANTEGPNESPEGGKKNELIGLVLDEEGQAIEGVDVLPGNEDCLKIRTDKAGRFHWKCEESLAANAACIAAAHGAILPEQIEPVAEAAAKEVAPSAAEAELPESLPVRFIKPGYAPLYTNWKPGRSGQVVTLNSKTYFEGQVLKPDGTPAANVPVRANQEVRAFDEMFDTSLWTETRTNAEGRYKLLVQPGAYVFSVGDSGAGIAWLPKRVPQPARQNPAAPRDDEERPERPKLEIQPSDVKKLDVQLEPCADFRARFVDSVTGLPVKGVQLDRTDFPDVHAQSDQNGAATIRSLPLGDNEISISVDGYVHARSKQASSGRQNTGHETNSDGFAVADVSHIKGLVFDVQLGMSEALILLDPPAKVSGRVLDPAGQPVAIATVRLVLPVPDAAGVHIEPSHVQVSSRKDGRFSIELPPSGSAKVNLMVYGKDRQERDDGDGKEHSPETREWANGVGPLMELVAGQKVENLELRLTRPGSIRGRLVDKAGKAVAAATVHCSAVDGLDGAFQNPEAKSDRDGYFELKRVRPGRHQLRGGESNPPDRHGRKRVMPFSENASVPVIDVRADETTNAGDVLIPLEE